MHGSIAPVSTALHILVGHHIVVGWQLVLRASFHVGHSTTKFHYEQGHANVKGI